MTGRTLLACFLRTYLVGAAFNTRGMQNVGVVYAMEPGLRDIYPDPIERRRARRRYLQHYNTHPFWTPLLVAVFLSLERQISLGLFPRGVLDNLKNTTTYTLSAIGDSVFGGSLLVFWSLSTSLLLIHGEHTVAFCWALLWILSLQIFKLATFFIGFKEGLKALGHLKRWDLINWGHRLKVLNAVLLCLVLSVAWPGAFSRPLWAASVGLLCMLAYMVSRLHVSREIIAMCILAILAVHPWLERIWGHLLK